MGKLENKNRDYFFDNIKGILILLVVFGHAIKPFMDANEIAKLLYCFIYFFHMPLFVFISGYFSKKQDIFKVINLFSTYLLWQIFLCPIGLMVFAGNNAREAFSSPLYPQWTY